MWFDERQPLQVALLEDRLVIDGSPQSDGAHAASVVPLSAPQAEAPSWQPAVTSLATWLRDKGLTKARLQVHLSGHFVRWQLLEWPRQLTQPQELDAYVQLRFRATFGAPAEAWRVICAEPVPGRALPACAVDETLMAALDELQAIGDARVVHVVPYFSAAFDRWRSRLGRQTAWFGVAEPGHLTLGLLHKGSWRGLRAMRHPDPSDNGWRCVLPAMQAQMALASGLDVRRDTPLFMAGCGATPNRRESTDLVWLVPQGKREPVQGIARMAWGV